MSYTVTISGHVTADTADQAQAVEQTICDALRAAIAALPDDAGVSTAAGSFQYLGPVSLLPEPPAPPVPALPDAVAELADAIAAGPEAGSGDAVSAAEWAAVVKAAAAVEAAAAALDQAEQPAEQVQVEQPAAVAL